MRINLISDLHDDIAGNAIKAMPSVEADVVVIAGDAMAPGSLALIRVRELFPDRSRPLIYVPGNHDYYSHHDKRRPELKTTFERERERMRLVAAEEGIILLDDGSVVIDGVLYIGATLWTDMRCRPIYMSHGDAMRSAARAMNDYRLIKTGAGRSRDTLKPGDTIQAHNISIEFIRNTLIQRPAEMDAVVITHHAPSPRSLLGHNPEIPTHHRDLDWCYASQHESLMHADYAPRLWLHGHIHQNRDYNVGHTRVVSNPRAYPGLGGSRENPAFDPGLVIELEPRPSLGPKI